MRFKSMLIAKSFLLNGYFIFGGGRNLGKLMVRFFHLPIIVLMKSQTGFLQVIEKAVEVDADSSQFPSNWIFHAREEKPGKAFVDGLNPVHYNV